LSGLGSHNQSNVATIYYKPAKQKISPTLLFKILTAHSQLKNNNNNNFHSLPHTHNEQNC
jgi:hypothetical protein